MEENTAVVVDSIIKGVMRDPDVHTDEYLDTLSDAELTQTKAALTQSGIEILKSLKYINAKLAE